MYTINVQAPPYVVTPKYDLGIRFSKVRFDDASIDTSRLPLVAADYPVTMETATLVERVGMSFRRDTRTMYANVKDMTLKPLYPRLVDHRLILEKMAFGKNSMK